MKHFLKLSCALFLPLVLLLGACSSTPEPGNGGGGNGGDSGPVISSFTANPPSIAPGGSSTLMWEVSGATSLTLRRSIDDEVVDLSNITSDSYPVSPPRTTEYTLIATNAQGDTTDDVEVTVEDVAEELTKLGFINLSEQTPSSGAAERAASGIFLEFTEGEELPDTFFTDPFEGSLDTCDVFLEDEAVGVLPPFTPAETPAYISAGAQVTLMAEGNVYATLERIDADISGENVTFYEADALGAPPADLTATVPGDAFPAFTGVTLPDVAPFTLTAPANTASITPTTTFTWEAEGDADAVVLISVTEFDTELEQTVTVSCTAQDDGTFTFPEDTQAALGDGFEGSLTSAGRQAYRTEIKEDAVLVLGTSSVQTFGAAPASVRKGFWASQF